MALRVTEFLSSSYQRVALELLRSTNLRASPAFDGTAMTLSTTAFDPEVFLRVEGNGLGFDAALAPVGHVDWLEVYINETSARAVRVPVDTQVEDLTDIAALIDTVLTELKEADPDWRAFKGLLTPGKAEIKGDAQVNVLEGHRTTKLLDGKGGDDVLIGLPFAPGTDNAVIKGGRGQDVLTFEGAREPILYLGKSGEIRTEGPDAIAYNVQGVEILVGSAFADTLQGSNGSDTIFGLDGDDHMSGADGGDALHGEDGDDAIGGHGGRDLLTGDAGNDTVSGGRGKDTIWGGDGNDILTGGGGGDEIDGGFGDDTVRGGIGPDTLTGGIGADTFLFVAGTGRADGRDVIEDFDRASDVVVIQSFRPDLVELRLLQSLDGTVMFYKLTEDGIEGRIKFRDVFFDETDLENGGFVETVDTQL